jgi:hypothetical protein
MGDRKNFIFLFGRASRASKNEIVAVVPQKAERTPVPGAGFSPEAVPGNEVERRTPEPLSYMPLGFESNTGDFTTKPMEAMQVIGAKANEWRKQSEL